MKTKKGSVKTVYGSVKALSGSVITLSGFWLGWAELSLKPPLLASSMVGFFPLENASGVCFFLFDSA